MKSPFSIGTHAAANVSSALLCATGTHLTPQFQSQNPFCNRQPIRRVLHDACPTTASLHRLFSENNIDGGLCVVSDSPQVSITRVYLLNFGSLGAQGLGLLQCRVWGASAVEEWPINILGFSAALAFLCDGSDDMLQDILAATPSAGDVMSSLQPFASVELKDSPTILSCLIEGGFYRGPVLKPRPSFAKVMSC